jgi:hypothetical protein
MKDYFIGDKNEPLDWNGLVAYLKRQPQKRKVVGSQNLVRIKNS